jgi:hypothetical protein
MKETVLKEFYIGRTVFLEPVNFKEKHTDNLLETLNLLETEFKIKQLEGNSDYLFVKFDYEKMHSRYLKPIIFYDNQDEPSFIIENIINIDFITGYHRYNEKQKFKLFLDKNDNLKLYQNLHYPNLISQKEKELENLKTKLLTINN